MTKSKFFKLFLTSAAIFLGLSTVAQALTFDQLKQAQTQGQVLGASTPAVLQSCTSGHYHATASCTLPSALTAGTTLVAVGYSGTTGASLSLSGCNLTWTNVFSDTTSPTFTWNIWTAPSIAGTSCAASQTINVTNWNFLNIMEVSGIGSLDVTPVDKHSPYCLSSCISNSLTTVTNGDLLLLAGFVPGAVETYGNFTNGFTLYQQQTFTTESGGFGSNADTYLLQSTAGAISTSYSISTVNGYADSILMAFKPAYSGTTSNPPVISNTASSGITQSSATISWTTDISSDSQVDYGTTTSYGSSSALNSSLVTSHSVSLSGLTANTLYHYRVKSSSNGNLAISADNTFTTTASSADTQAPTSQPPLLLPQSPHQQSI